MCIRDRRALGAVRGELGVQHGQLGVTGGHQRTELVFDAALAGGELGELALGGFEALHDVEFDVLELADAPDQGLSLIHI